MRAQDQTQTTATFTLGDDGRLALPAEIRRLVALEAGDAIEVVVVADGILLRPCAGDDDDPAVV